jgi:hypothetical protein
MDRLRCEPEVRADRDASLYEEFHDWRGPPFAFQFHHVRARLHQPDRAVHGEFSGLLIAAKGHVGNESSGPIASGNTAAVVTHFINIETGRVVGWPCSTVP